MASPNPDHSSCHQDKHQAPTLLHVHPLSLQDGGRPSHSFPDSIGKNHNRRCARSIDTRSTLRGPLPTPDIAEAPYDGWISSLIAKQPFSKIFTVNDLFSPYLNQIITYYFSPGCRVKTVHCLLMHNQEINSGMGAVSRKFPLFCTSARSDTSDATVTKLQVMQLLQTSLEVH